jgi:hypothetical protein
MPRPKSVSPQVVTSSFSYTPGSVPANGTLDITLTSTTDAAIGRLRAYYNVNLWASAAMPNAISIVNQACYTPGQLYFRLMNSSAAAVAVPATTFFLQQM